MQDIAWWQARREWILAEIKNKKQIQRHQNLLPKSTESNTKENDQEAGKKTGNSKIEFWKVWILQGVNIRSNPGVNVQNNLGDAEMGKKGSCRGARVNIGDLDEMVRGTVSPLDTNWQILTKSMKCRMQMHPSSFICVKFWQKS